MWLELVIDLFTPTREVKSVEHLVEKSQAGKLAVEFRVPGAFARRLNESGWLADEVIAAGRLRQGKAPSTAVEVLATGVRAGGHCRPCRRVRVERVERVERGRRDD
jgi:hypothetical protein